MELTKGNLYHQMLALCASLIAGNILQQFYNTIDAWIIGKYAGMRQFAAVGIAGTAMNLFLFFIVGLCTGISVIFAQLYGAKDMKLFRKEHFQTLLCGTIFTILFSLAGIFVSNSLLNLLGTPSSLFLYTHQYLMIVLLGLSFSFLYNFYNALLRATGNVKFPLIILLCAVLTNLFADVYFVKNLEMGIQGAAMATVLSQMLSVILSVLYMIRKNHVLCFQKEDFGLSKKLLQKTVSISLVTGIHQASLYLGKMFVQGAVNASGTDMITAYTATTRIEGFINSFGDSGAAATSVIIAQNFGAVDKKRIRHALHTSAVVLMIFGVVCAWMLCMSASYTVSFMLQVKYGEAFEQAKMYLQMISLFYIFCFLGNTFTGFFDGIGKTMIPFIGAAGHITLRAILSWAWIQKMGLVFVAWACGIGWILADIFWLFMMRKVKQKEENHSRQIITESV